LLFYYSGETLGQHEQGTCAGSVGVATLKVDRFVEQRAGDEPGYLQACVLSVLFYLSVTFTSGLVLLVPLFSDRGRCLHDIVTGVFVINAAAPEDKA